MSSNHQVSLDTNVLESFVFGDKDRVRDHRTAGTGVFGLGSGSRETIGEDGRNAGILFGKGTTLQNVLDLDPQVAQTLQTIRLVVRINMI